MATRRLLDVDDLSAGELDAVLLLAERADLPPVLAGMGVAMAFERPSTRSRNSTELAARLMGGHPVHIRGDEAGVGTPEPAADVARTLACYQRVRCARVVHHAALRSTAAALDAGGIEVPVVNLLSDTAHPCQAPADPLALRAGLAPGAEAPGLAGRALAYVGEASTVSRSLAKGALMAGMAVGVASPAGCGLCPAQVADLAALAEASGRGGSRRVSDDPGRRHLGGRRRPHRRVAIDGQRGRGRPPAAGVRRLHGRRGAGGGGPWSDGAALPAGPPWGGDHRRGHRRAEARGLGPGGSAPDGHAGAARLAARRVRGR